MKVFILACAKSDFEVLVNIKLFRGYHDHLWTTQGLWQFSAFPQSKETEMECIH